MNCLKQYNLKVEGGRVRWKRKRRRDVEGGWRRQTCHLHIL